MNPLFRSALRFFFLFLLLYGALIGISLIPKVGAFCNQLYCKPTQPILQSLLSKAYLQLKTDPASPNDIRVEYASKEKVQQQMRQANQTGQKKTTVHGKNIQVEFYNLFLTFFLLFVALMVLSPLPLKTKILRIVVGSLLFYGYTVFKMWMALLHQFSQPENAIYPLDGFWQKVAGASVSILTLGVNLLVVLLLWSVLVFDKKNWKGFLDNA